MVATQFKNHTQWGLFKDAPTRCVAVRKARMMICGCMPSSMYDLTCFRNSAASRVTEVVPSPTWRGQRHIQLLRLVYRTVASSDTIFIDWYPTAVSHLCILGLCNVHQGLGSRMNHIQELQDGGPIIGDGGFACRDGVVMVKRLNHYGLRKGRRWADWRQNTALKGSCTRLTLCHNTAHSWISGTPPLASHSPQTLQP